MFLGSHTLFGSVFSALYPTTMNSADSQDKLLPLVAVLKLPRNEITRYVFLGRVAIASSGYLGAGI
jgi:hypothetical protein